VNEGDFLSEYRGDGPLRHLTVLDFTQMLMGPLATQLLGDLGALVIKVEPPRGEWERSFLPRGRRFHGESAYFLALNRNKLSLRADLKDDADRALVFELVGRADVVVSNFRPGVMDRLGFGFDALVERNPKLVFATGSGYGQVGPQAGRPGQDLLVQAMSGLASNTGGGDGPPVATAAAVCDGSAGFLLAFAILAAVLDARLTGTPRAVDVSLLGAALLLQSPEAFLALNTDLEWRRSSVNAGAPWFGAPYGFYAATDGWIAIAMTPRDRLVDLFQLPRELVELDEEDWYQQRDEVNKLISSIVAERSTREWLELFEERDVWAAPLLSLSEALAHPQVRENGLVERVTLGTGRGDASAVGLATVMSDLEFADRLPPPRLGEHNEVIRDAVARADA
jgi:crotonobetainyl-CoA:carnitine CoA-transferase CaiB-like acyl-CoA transferase